MRMSWSLQRCLRALLFFGLTTTAQAQTVVKSIAEKGWVVSTFQESSSAKKGQHACFLDDSGTTVACGKVIKVTDRLIVVKVTPISAAAQVKNGFKIEISEGRPASGKAVTRKTKSRSGGQAIRLITSPGTGVISVAKVGYVAPAANASGVILWEGTDAKLSVEKISLGMEYELAKYASTIGIRYAVYGELSGGLVSEHVLQTDYDPANQNKFVEATHSVSAIGSYYDYIFLAPRPRKSGFRIVSGVDYMSSTAKVSATLNDDSDNSKVDLATLTSTLSVVSLRAGVDYQLRIGKSFELGLGLRTLVPLAEFGLTQKTSLNDENITKSTNEQDDIKKALDHKKSPVAISVPIYMSMNF